MGLVSLRERTAEATGLSDAALALPAPAPGVFLRVPTHPASAWLPGGAGPSQGGREVAVAEAQAGWAASGQGT